MKTPKYTITNLILEYIVQYELAIKEIDNKKLPDEHLNTLLEKYGAEDMQNLGDLVGNSIGYTQALQIQRGQEMPSKKSSLKLFINFRNAKDFTHTYNNRSSLKPSFELASHINKLAMKGIVDEWDLAKPRHFSDKPNEIYDTWYKLRDFYPKISTTEHFNEIFEWIDTGKDGNHKLIKFGILLYELIDKAPFLAGNQITSILMLEILGKIYGYNPRSTIPFFRSINNIDEEILSAFKLSKSSRDLTTFLEAFLYTISSTVIAVKKDYIQTYTSKVEKRGNLGLHLNERQIQLLNYLEINEKVKRNKFAKMMGVSFMTAYRDITDMLEKKYLKQKGRGRGTYYVLSKEMTPKDEELL